MKKFVSALVALGVVCGSVGIAFGFVDVTEDDLYYDSVVYLSEQGIVTGYADGSFGYDAELNRAELLTIIIRAAGIELDSAQWIAYSGENCFTDVEGGEWYTQYVCLAKDYGWVGGYPDGSFAPATEVNFVEALKITLQAFEVDYDSDTDPWYQGLTDVADAEGFMPPTVDSLSKKITRGEMCYLLEKIMKWQAGDVVLNDPEGCYYYHSTYDFDVFYPCHWVANESPEDYEGFLVLNFGEVEPPCEDCDYIKDEINFWIVETDDMIDYLNSHMEFVSSFFPTDIGGHLGYKFDGGSALYGLYGAIVELSEGKALYLVGPSTEDGIEAVNTVVGGLDFSE